MPITFESGDTWAQPKTMLLSVRLRPRPGISMPRGFFMLFASRLAAVTLAAMMCWSMSASAQQPMQQQPMQQLPPEQQQQLPPPVRQPSPNTYGPDELT